MSLNVTEPIFLGQPQIVWSALEGIGTILAVVLALDLWSKTKRWFIKPRLTISNLVCRSLPRIDEDEAEENISFDIANKPILGQRGEDITGFQFSSWVTAEKDSHVIKSIHTKYNDYFIPANGKMGFGFTVASPFIEKATYYVVVRFRINEMEVLRERFDFIFDTSDMEVIHIKK